MAKENSDSNGGCGCFGCLTTLVGVILFIFLMYALFDKVQINDNTLEINLFPPKIIIEKI